MMDLDELQSVQSRERQTDSLQQLRESFYQEAGEFIQQLQREREHAAERADDPWNSPEVSRLSDDIETAESTVEAIYERRVGKIVKMASLAAADMPTEDDGLTAEEQELFDSLVARIEANRERVETVLDGEEPPTPDDGRDTGTEPAAPTGETDAPDPVESQGTERSEPAVDSGERARATDESETPPPPSPEEMAPDHVGEGEADTRPAEAAGTGPEEETGTAPPEATGSTTRPPSDEGSVGAADLMGSGSDEESAGSEDESEAVRDGGTEMPEIPERTGSDADSSADSDADSTEESADPAVDRATVKITADVGEIYGVDQRSYDLSTEDVVQLPEANAEPLVERDAAERLE